VTTIAVTAATSDRDLQRSGVTRSMLGKDGCTSERVLHRHPRARPRSRQWMADIEGYRPHWAVSGQGEAVRRGALALHLDVQKRGVGRITFRPRSCPLRCSKLSSTQTRKDDAEGAPGAEESCCPGARPRRPPVHAGPAEVLVSRTSRPAVARQLTTGLPHARMAWHRRSLLSASDIGSVPVHDLYSHVTRRCSEKRRQDRAALFG